MSRDLTTVDTRASTHADVVEPALSLTILWHPSVDRIGRVARLGLHDRPGVSRLQPVFDDGEPLADARASRSVLRIVPGRAGAVTLWPGRTAQVFSVDGRPGSPGVELSAAALERGVQLGLGGKGPLLLLRSGAPASSPTRYGLVGPSPTLSAVRDAIDALGPTPYPVLIQGQTGTGKELVARGLHAASRRSDGPFVAINLAALAPGTAVSQLFGHTRGAFTGADRADAGFFGQAEGGTLFLDELGAAPLDVQAQLLRALESNEVQPVGGGVRQVDVRVVAATDEDLDAAIAEGRFRRALLHRLAHGRVELTPLCGRLDDVAAQSVHFLRHALDQAGRARVLDDAEAPWLGRKTLTALLDARWSGNSRELRGVCEQLVVRFAAQARCGIPAVERATADAPGPPAAPAWDDRSTPAESLTVAEALAQNGYRMIPAAQALGMSRNRLRREMARLGLPRPGDLTRDQVQAALAAHGSLSAAARALQVSERGLKLRVRELGLPQP